MHIKNLLFLTSALLTSSLALANTLDSDDVPNRCWQVCGPVVGISHKCDAMHDNDSAERKCVCEWQQAPTLIPLCEACISQYRNETKHDDDNDRDDDDDRDDDRDNDRDDDNDNDHDSRTKPLIKRSIRKSKCDDPHNNDANDILRACSFTTTSYNPTTATSAISAASTLIPSSSATATGTSSASGSSSGSGSRSASGSGSSESASADNDTNAASGQSVPRAASLAAVVGLIGLVWL
ncbi:hypothetical protein SI65_04354 [Aspergillus cristatus]|uniref:GPI anchored protein n=1 Tax=Aspergillus cristatus TaxID=573508 RepID=A0A1E3BKJ2_ASPCR|nr:hypothetical protein SI65_04354 [Aspergillus cristatus]